MERENPNFEKDPRDLEEAQEVIAALRKRLEYDPYLESLLNKRATERRIEARVASDKVFALFLIDLDNFKLYNDTYGHRRGDRLLRKLEEILQQYFRRAGDEAIRTALEVGRIGGDEFLVIMAELMPDDWPEEANQRTRDPYEQMSNIKVMLRQVETRLLEEDSDAQKVGVGFSIGSALFDPNQPVSAEELFDQADAAMYAEKREHKQELAKRGLFKPR